MERNRTERERERESEEEKLRGVTCENDLRRTLWWLFGYFDGHTPLRGWLYPAPVQ